MVFTVFAKLSGFSLYSEGRGGIDVESGVPPIGMEAEPVEVVGGA